jgi:hypothetical protein
VRVLHERFICGTSMAAFATGHLDPNILLDLKG